MGIGVSVEGSGVAVNKSGVAEEMGVSVIEGTVGEGAQEVRKTKRKRKEEKIKIRVNPCDLWLSFLFLPMLALLTKPK